MRSKLDLLIQASKDNEGKVFVFADADVILLDFSPSIADNNIRPDQILVAQNDRGDLCAGMMIMRGGEKLTTFFKNALTTLIFKNKDDFDDQDAINQTYRSKEEYRRAFGFLPEKLFGCIGHFNGGRLWDGVTRPPISNICHTFHANWTEGVQNKINLLNLILLNKKSPICLITSIYEDKVKERCDELIECFTLNYKNVYIDKYIIYYDTSTPERGSYTLNKIKSVVNSGSKPLTIINCSGKPQFNIIINDINRDLISYRILLCNSDIYYDTTLNYICNIGLKNKAIFLTRYNEKDKKLYFGNCDFNGSFDTYIFDSPLRVPQISKPTKLGEYHCDGILAGHLLFHGYRVYNPCLSIASYHKHSATEWDSQTGKNTDESNALIPKVDGQYIIAELPHIALSEIDGPNIYRVNCRDIFTK